MAASAAASPQQTRAGQDAATREDGAPGKQLTGMLGHWFGNAPSTQGKSLGTGKLLLGCQEEARKPLVAYLQVNGAAQELSPRVSWNHEEASTATRGTRGGPGWEEPGPKGIICTAAAEEKRLGSSGTGKQCHKQRRNWAPHNKMSGFDPYSASFSSSPPLCWPTRMTPGQRLLGGPVGIGSGGRMAHAGGGAGAGAGGGGGESASSLSQLALPGKPARRQGTWSRSGEAPSTAMSTSAVPQGTLTPGRSCRAVPQSSAPQPPWFPSCLSTSSVSSNVRCSPTHGKFRHSSPSEENVT